MMKLYLILALVVTFLSAEVRTQVIMGTYVSIDVEKFHKEAFKRISAVDLYLSSYNTQSEIYKLNKLRKYEVSDFVLGKIVYSKRLYDLTDGYFQLTIGNITHDICRFGIDERIPNKEELEHATTGWDNVHQEGNKIELLKSVKLDFGGIGKGIAVDEAVLVLKDLGIKEGIVSASGDMHCIGLCSVGIQNPFKEDVLVTFSSKKKDLSISTSGNYRRFIKSKEFNHLFNPKTKSSQKVFASVTLISYESNAYIDALATAISVMPLEKALSFLEKHKELGYLLVTTDLKLIFGNLESFVTHDIKYNEIDRDEKKYLKDQKTYPFDYGKEGKVSYKQITAGKIGYRAQ